MTAATEPSPAREQQLQDEARHFHAALFGFAAPDGIVQDYVRAHHFYCDPSADEIDFSAIVAGKLDAEALELACRGRHPALTRKFRILVYLAEARPLYYPLLVNSTDRRLYAWVALSLATVRAALKRVKGRLLLRRHPVA